MITKKFKRNAVIFIGLILLLLWINSKEYPSRKGITEEGFIVYDDFSGADNYNVQYENKIIVKGQTTCLNNTCDGTYLRTEGDCDIWSYTTSMTCGGDHSVQCIGEGCGLQWYDEPWCGSTVSCANSPCHCSQITNTYYCAQECGGTRTITGDYYFGTESMFTTNNIDEIILPNNTKSVWYYPQDTATLTINGQTLFTEPSTPDACWYSSGSIMRLVASTNTYNFFDYDSLSSSKLHYGENTITGADRMKLIIQTGNCISNWQTADGTCRTNTFPVDSALRCDFDKWIKVPTTVNKNQNVPFVSNGLSNIGGLSVMDFKDYDLQIQYYGNPTLSLNILEDNDLIKQKITKSYPISNLFTQDRIHILKISHSLLSPGKLYIENDGFKIAELTIPEDNIHVQIGPNVDLVGYKPMYGCVQGPDEILGIQTLGPGEQVSIYSTNFVVKRLCYEHLPLITKANSGSTTNIEIFNLLIAGGTYHIKSDETLTMFYVFDNDGTLPSTCPDEAYDTDNQICRNITGVAQICSTGNFDPATGVCLIQANETNTWCEFGRLDTAQMKCIYSPPLQAVCGFGSWNSVAAKCQWQPGTGNDCSVNNGTYNPISQFCEAFPLKTIICYPEFAYDSLLDKCVKDMDTAEECINVGGNYSNGKCIKDVEVNMSNICPDGILYQNPSTFEYSCILEPNYQNGTCTNGNWDSQINACVVTPNLHYLCINGELNDAKTACVLVPKTVFICPTGTTYDSEMNACLSGINGTGVYIQCPEGSYYNSTSKKCVYVGTGLVDIGNTTVALCEEGATYDQELNICVKSGQPWLVVLGFSIIFLLYFLWEKGPKSGIFKKK